MFPLILEPEELLESPRQESLLLIDLSPAPLYRQAHLPGAVHVMPAELISGIQPATGKLPSKQQLESLFSRIGLTSDQHVIAYDHEGGGWAGRFIWTLDVIGHNKASFLNGGIRAWIAAGGLVDNTAVQPTPTLTTVDIDVKPIATMEQVLDSIDDDNVRIWDARSAEEYLGAKVLAQRGGHIPGAINFDWLGVMDRHNNLKIRTDLKELLQQAGLTPDKRIITHCQTHHRSGLTYLAGRWLGYDISAYDGSWSEWGNDPTMPITQPTET